MLMVAPIPTNVKNNMKRCCLVESINLFVCFVVLLYVVNIDLLFNTTHFPESKSIFIK